MSGTTNGSITSTARSTYDAPAAGASFGHDSGTYRPPSVASPARRTSAKPSSGAAPRVDTYRMSGTDHTQQTADVVHDVEVAQLADRRLDGRLAGDVGDEHEPCVGTVALLLGDTDADVVLGEHTGDGVEHAGA